MLQNLLSYLIGSRRVDGDHDLHPERLVLHVDGVRVDLAELGEQHVARKHLVSHFSIDDGRYLK